MKNNKKIDDRLLKNLLIIVIILSFVVGIVCFFKSRVSVDLSKTSARSSANSTATSGSVWTALKQKGLQGDHFTLNVHGKKSNFNKSDCTATPDPVTGEYGNNVFIPSNSDQSSEANQIIMSSGNAKGKFASTNPIFGVRDTCTAAFDGDAAEMVIPPNEKGYYVVARVLGKPTNNPQLQLQGDLMWVQDENGNDLLVLGLVTDNGFQTPTTTLTRTKGKVNGVDISGLFAWNGSVCYFNPQNYCYDSANQFICTNTSMCCQDTDLNGVYDSCVAPTLAADGTQTCATGYQLTSLACRDYENEWVFNIGDFVGYMWDTYTDGDFKLANIRFYPIK